MKATINEIARHLRSMADRHAESALYATAAYFFELAGGVDTVENMRQKAEHYADLNGTPVKMIGYCTDCKHYHGSCQEVYHEHKVSYDEEGDGQQLVLYLPDGHDWTEHERIGVDVPFYFGCIKWEQRKRRK